MNELRSRRGAQLCSVGMSSVAMPIAAVHRGCASLLCIVAVHRGRAQFGVALVGAVHREPRHVCRVVARRERKLLRELGREVEVEGGRLEPRVVGVARVVDVAAVDERARREDLEGVGDIGRCREIDWELTGDLLGAHGR